MRNTIQVLASDYDQIYTVYHLDSYINVLQRTALLDLIKDDCFVSSTRLLQVKCPHLTCQVEPLKWCRYPDNRPMNGLHLARWKFAYSQGFWGAKELILPNINNNYKDEDNG